MFFWKNRKVAVTGATGFVGYQVALEFRRAGAEVIALVRATSNLDRLRAAGVTTRIAALDDVDGLTRSLADCEFVAHAAGAVGFGTEWETYYRVNVEGTRNLLAAARRAGVRRLVHTSSIVAVAASARPILRDETAPWNLGGFRVPYATTKRWAEEGALAANGPGLDVVVVNPGSVVGPDDFSGSEFGTLCRRFWKGRVPFHFRGGNNFVDVRDVAAGIRCAVERGRAGERYLLTGSNCTYAAFFGELCRAAGRTIPRLCLPQGLAGVIGYLNDRLPRQNGTRPYLSSAQAALMGLYFFFDASKARRELGFHARPLAESLADTYAFWRTPPARRTLSA